MKSATDHVNKTGLSQCSRCGGLMVRERFYDWTSDSGNLEFEGVRCLVCGEIVDPLIIVHRGQSWTPNVTTGSTAGRAKGRHVMQHNPLYLSIPPLVHLDNVEQSISRSQRRLRWLLGGIVLLSLFLIGMAIWRAW